MYKITQLINFMVDELVFPLFFIYLKNLLQVLLLKELGPF